MIHRFIRRALGAAAAALALTFVVPAAPASAQNLFEALFGNMPRHAPPPPQASAFADPFGLFERRRPAAETGGGPAMAYCVRTCDGRFFPVQRSAGASHAQLCKSFCPAANTAVFSGSKIDHAVGPGGIRYAEMENAHLYRTKIVEGCTCNGKDSFGLARVNVAEDPTLRPGDIVATNEGLATYRGGRNPQAAQFTPISASASELSRRLADTKVVPQPETQETVPALVDDTPLKRKPVRRSAQVTRSYSR